MKQEIKQKKDNKKLLFVIFILCLTILSPMLIISKYNRPCADDYDYSLLTYETIQKKGAKVTPIDIVNAAWKTDVKFYNTWQGLYTSAFVLALQPGIWGEKMYVLTPFIVLLICYLCILGAMYILNRHFLKKSMFYCIVVSFGILTFFALWLPSPVEGIYWYNGAMNYIPWVFANLLNVCLLIEIWFNKNKHINNALIIGSVILSFLISGANHVTAFSNILLLIFFSIYLIRKKKYYSLLPLFSALVGFGIMYIAPGTMVRQSVFEKQSVLDTIFATVQHVYQISGGCFSPIWLLSLILITPVAIEFANSNKKRWQGISLKHIIFTVLGMLMILCGMFCVPYYAMKNFGAGRLENVIWITFMFFSWIVYSMIWLFLTVKNYVNISKFTAPKAKILLGTVTCVGLICLFLMPINGRESNSLIAYHELRNHTASNYGEEMDERIKRYNDKTLEVVEVEELRAKSRLLYFDDLGYSPDKWPNTVMNKYYKKKIYKVADSKK